MDHGSDFPGLATYKDRWTTYKDRWTTLLQQSRDLANLTSANYKQYDQVFLNIVQNVQDKQEMVEAAEALSMFSEEKPVGIPLDISQKFLDLRNDVERFQKEFNDYIETQRVQLLQLAKVLQQEIDGLLKQIDGLTAAVLPDFNVASGPSIIFAFTADFGSHCAHRRWRLVEPGIAIIGLAISRAQKQKELAVKQAELAEVNRKQEALAHIKSEFDGLDPDIKIISSSLSLFADIWRQFHGEAEEFAKVLRDVQNPTSIPRVFKLRVELARTIARPLQEALEAYANTIGTR
ncbi:hypothetical protein HYDPIDRAFT_171360 [Hydnomerulius pinastri MD-312]|uniref:Uncharacterized protein n=1 Tax=Hydnomerulius pinastri MD-312 TaxID=994086 RepID=A0A0C9W784_9AGAM|nr:hypothetical protein HYDPIDRAFT_171360 [Hydnomerulius pinastri MD-312]